MTDDTTARPRLIIYDLDGTLVDSSADIAASANEARRAVGLPPLSAAITVGYVGDGVQLLLERVMSHDLATGRRDLPVAPDQLARALATFAAHYEHHLLDRTAIYPGIVELLAARADRRQMVATNKPRRFTLAILAGLGIDRWFERVVAGDDVAARKPDPDHLRACLAGTGLGPGDAVMVGDSPNDVLAAQGLGMRSVAVSWGLVARDRLVAAQPSVLVDDVASLARSI